MIGPHNSVVFLLYKPHIHPFSKLTTFKQHIYIKFKPIKHTNFHPFSCEVEVDRMSREGGGGDWMCGACQYINFKKREACQRCGCPKYATGAEVSAYAAQKTEVMQAGDWYCGGMNCGAHNYASRTTCYRCGGAKEYCGYGAGIMASAGYAHAAIPGWKTGDWICTR